jgi:hypothetical protein
VLATPRGFVYDERPYLLAVLPILDEVGLGRTFLLEYPHGAGISLGVLHWVLRPITGLEPVLVRLVNPVLFAVVLWLMRDVLGRQGVERPGTVALAALSVPFTWVIVGLALTETVGLICTMAGFWLLVWVGRRISVARPLPLTAAVGAGALMGLAFFGRPPLLVVPVAAGVWPLIERRMWPAIGALWAGVALTVAPAVAVWGGLVAPRVDFFWHDRFSVANMALSLGYAGAAMAVICPQWYRLSARVLAALFVGGAVLNAAAGAVRITPLAGVVSLALQGAPQRAYAVVAGSIVVGVALVFVAASLRNIRERRGDAAWLVTTVAMLAMVAAVGKISHQFSSRYTGLAVVLMVLASAPYRVFSPLTNGLLAAGSLVGALSLGSYLLY